MPGLGGLLKKLGESHGIMIDDEELEALGLDDDRDQGEADATDEVLSQPLPGHAAGMVELYLAADSTMQFEGKQEGDLLWYPIIREGQWAVRPGTTGKKRRVPLKVISGKSKNQRREIGLQDLKDAFDDEAVQHVTVPTSHNNDVLENTGFIKGMKIVDGTVKDKKTKAMTKVKVLMGGYDIKLPKIKERLQLGAIANRSAGLLYDYVNTETGKTYPAVVEHVALTNKPWITGMVSFGRKLKEGTADERKPQTVAMSLSDEGPETHEYALMLSDEAEIADAGEGDFLAEEATDWSKEDSPGWLRQQVNQILRDARAAKIKAMRVSAAAAGKADLTYDEYPTDYRCVEARPGMALISDGYGDDSNHWTAPISIKDGAVALDDYNNWKAIVKAFIPDERPALPKNKLPLSEGGEDPAAVEPPKSRLELAQESRRVRVRQEPVNDDKNPREVVEHMAGDATEHLSAEEAQRRIGEAEERARKAEQRAQNFERKLERVTGAVQTGETKDFLSWLRRDPSEHDKTGLGLSEARGFGGVLTTVEELLMADDGEPAVQSDQFSDDSHPKGELSVTDVLRRVFLAVEKTREGKTSLGEMLHEPADPEADDKTKKNGEDDKTEETGTKASTDKPGGKPGAGDPEAESLSTDERRDKILEVSPGMAALTGRTPSSASEGSK